MAKLLVAHRSTVRIISDLKMIYFITIVRKEEQV